VVLVALALAIDASAIGFLDPTLSDHVHRLLGLDSKTAGTAEIDRCVFKYVYKIYIHIAGKTKR
jgi:hypothetical protein